LVLQIRCDHHTFGIVSADCADLTRAFISDTSPHITGAALRGWRRNYAGAYIVQMEHIPVFNTADFVQACATVRTSLLTQAKTTITVTVAPDRKEALQYPGYSPQLHVDQFRPVVHTLYEMREGRSITADEIPDDDEISHAIRSISVSDDIGVKVGPSPDLGNAPDIEYVDGTLPGSSWIRRRLMKLSCWPRWKKAETAQLDSMKKDGMYGPPCFAPKGAIVLRTVWTYYVKWDVTLKSRSCCGGSVLKGHGLSYALNYTACISQPGMRIFWAIVAIRGWVSVGADAINAFAQADPRNEPTYVRIDDQMVEWMEDASGSRPDRSQVLPVICALQGHPAAGSSWTDKVEDLLMTQIVVVKESEL
jgi:hypothetical protein